MHFLTFMILTAEFFFIFNTKRKELKMLRYITLLVCTGGASIGLEILQSLVNPTRVFDIYDILCNIAGSLVGVGVSSGYLMWVMKNKRPQKQSYRMDVRQPPNRIEQDDVIPEEEDYIKIEMKDAAEQV